MTLLQIELPNFSRTSAHPGTRIVPVTVKYNIYATIRYRQCSRVGTVNDKAVKVGNPWVNRLGDTITLRSIENEPWLLKAEI